MSTEFIPEIWAHPDLEILTESLYITIDTSSGHKTKDGVDYVLGMLLFLPESGHEIAYIRIRDFLFWSHYVPLSYASEAACIRDLLDDPAYSDHATTLRARLVEIT